MIGLGWRWGRHMVLKGFELTGYDISTEAANRAKSHGVKLTTP